MDKHLELPGSNAYSLYLNPEMCYFIKIKKGRHSNVFPVDCGITDVLCLSCVIQKHKLSVWIESSDCFA